LIKKCWATPLGEGNEIDRLEHSVGVTQVVVEVEVEVGVRAWFGLLVVVLRKTREDIRRVVGLTRRGNAGSVPPWVTFSVGG